MTEKIKARTLAGFNNEGTYVKRGASIELTQQRFNDLKEVGLVELDTEAKKAPAPANKQRHPPANKQK
jgi:hypothetical protein